ncbi:hypothetical protein OS493_040177, partial [Desmophyllum pertusum]
IFLLLTQWESETEAQRWKMLQFGILERKQVFFSLLDASPWINDILKPWEETTVEEKFLFQRLFAPKFKNIVDPGEGQQREKNLLSL